MKKIVADIAVIVMVVAFSSSIAFLLCARPILASVSICVAAAATLTAAWGGGKKR